MWDDHLVAWVKMGDGERREVSVGHTMFETPVRC